MSEDQVMAASNPAMEAMRRNPRSALLALARETIAVITGGELARGEPCKECGHGPVGVLQDVIRASLACLGIEGEITSEDMEDKGRLGPYGEPATEARLAENEAEYGIAYRVREFHARFGHKIRRRPEIPTDDEARHRARLVTEEYLEFMDAIFPRATALSHIRGMLREAIQVMPVEVDLPELEDALQDLDYVSEGTRATCGIDRERGARAVHASNMAKEPVFDADGKPDPLSKPTKPVGWEPPDMAAVLRAQGWTP